MELIWLRLSVIYLMLGVAAGIAIGATQHFELHPIHAHINLLGWAVPAIVGLTYTLFPRAANSWLGLAQFWLHNIGAPLMLASLTFFLTGHPGALSFLEIGELIVALGVVAYLLNVFVYVGRSN
ncbi:hypothetical protein ACAX43_27080 [Paraburkholderia sp. IW21]|uniref:hypothetical protein n=1 Tax=Paraburkholderia sp. IW21 TaxID=3242488 RepID=UPI003522E71F